MIKFFRRQPNQVSTDPHGATLEARRDALLRVSKLAKRFQIHQIERSISVLRDVNFELYRGQFIRVSGPNGAGKSSLLRCIFRTYLPTAGSVVYQSDQGPVDLAIASDIDIAWLRKQELGFVTQFLRPRPRVSALELVAEPLIQNGVPNEEATRQGKDMLANFGLREALWKAYPATFSGGEQQKVNLARGLILKRRILLLDEPTASLDAVARDALATRLNELKSSGVSMIAVSHHPEDIQELIDNTVELTLQKTEENPIDVVA